MADGDDGGGTVAYSLRRAAQHSQRAAGQTRTGALAGLFRYLRRTLHLGIWSPQIIKTLGLSDLTIGFVNAVPAVVAVLAMVLWAKHSDKTNERSWHAIAACLLAAVGLCFAGNAGTILTVLCALTLVNCGISAAKPPLWSMPTLFLSGSAAAAGIATINSIGNLGGFVGPFMIGLIKEHTGSFSWGLYFVAALLVVSSFIVFLLSGKAPERPSTRH